MLLSETLLWLRHVCASWWVTPVSAPIPAPRPARTARRPRRFPATRRRGYRFLFTLAMAAGLAQPAWAQTTVGPRNAGTGASVDTASSNNIAWSNPGQAVSSDNLRASAALGTGTNSSNSRYLRTTNYGFSIPTGSTILGITVSVERFASASSSIRDLELQLLKGGVLTGSDKAATSTNWPTTEATVTYGGTSDLWGTTWTPAEINAADFGVSFRARNVDGSNRTANVDAILVSVTYLPPPGPPSAAHSTITVDKSSIPDDGTSSATITVQLKDADGRDTTATTETVTLSTNLGTLTASGGSPTGSSITLTSTGGGTYTATITSTSTGTATLTALLNAATLGTANLNVVERPNAANSVVTATPSTRPANGISASTITVQLKNASGGNVTFSGGPVTLTTTRGTLSAVTDNNNGTYSATISSTSAGAATITGYLGGVAMGTTATVTFEPFDSFNVNYQTINLSNMTLLSGTALSAGAVYQKLSAITIDGQVLDARIAIAARSNVSDFLFDNDNTHASRFQPEINSSSSSGGFVDFTLSFYLGGTNTKVNVRNFYLTAVDVDGSSSTVSEYLELKDFSSYLLDATTQITVGPGARPGFTRFFGRASSLPGIEFDDTCALIARYDIPLSDIEFRLGYSGSSSSRRLHSLEFGAVGGTFSNPGSQVPIITGPSGGPGASASAKSIPENTTPVHTFTANKPVVWTLNGGVDEAKFTIDYHTGALSFIDPPDFENPTDADANNTYIVVVRASDGDGLAADQTVTVTVTDVVAGDPTQYVVTSSDYGPMAGTNVTITAQLADANGTPVAMPKLTVTWTKSHGSGSFASATGVTDADGKATVVFTTHTISGTATTVTASTGYITGTSPTITTTAGAISVAATGTELSGTDLTRVADGVQAATVTLQLRDVNGSAISKSGVAVTFATTAGTLSATATTTNASGQAVVTLTSTSVGQAQVTATVDDDENSETLEAAVTRNSPVTVTFTTGPISVASTGSLLSGTDLTRVADGVSAATITVQLRDAQGRDLSEAGVEVTFATTRGTLSSTTAVTTNSSGVATVTLTSTETGSADVTASIASFGAVTHGSPVTVTFTSGPASTATSTITASPTSITANGTSTSTVTVQLKDAQGNNLTASGGTVTLSPTLGTLGAVTDNNNGTYTATLTSATTVGTANVTGTLDSNAIAAKATVDFTPGPASTATSTITASPTSITADGTSTSTITVQLKDAHGNDLTTSGGTVTLAQTLGTLGTVTDNANGTYTATLTSATTTGTSTITGALGGNAITDDATVAFVPGAASTATSTIVANPTSITANGTSTSTVTVQLKDTHGNNLTASGGAVTLTPTLGTLGTVTDNANGTYTATLTSATTTGTATITGTLAGNALAAKATVDFTPGPASTATSTIAASPTTITANGTSTSAITVQLKDAHGNNLTASGGTVVLATTLGTLGTVTDNTNGTYTATLTSATTVGTATITGTLDSAAIAGKATVAFSAGSPTTEMSTITASPTSITANGTSTSTITVQLKDANGNNLTASGGTVTLSQTLGTLGPVTDNNDGTYTATLTSATTVGTSTITATLNSAALADSATVAFTAGTASGATSTITATPTSITANGTSTSTVTVQLKDAHGNNLTASGGTVTLSTSLGTLGSVIDNNNGTYTATLTSATTVGTATVSGAVAGNAIASTATVTFTPGPASAATSTITAAPTSITANGTSTSTVTVQLKDAHGNNLTTSGGTVTLSQTLGSLGTVTDHNNGTYTATLTSATTVGTSTISGTVAGNAITATATVAFTPGPASTATSTITANPTSITANGTSTSTLTVQLEDAHGNNLTASGGTVVLSPTLGTLGTVTDHGNGTYTATLTSATTVGTATISGTIDGNAIASTATVAFTPGPASTATSTVTASPASIAANGTSTSTVTVQLKDAHGNNLTTSGGTVALSTSLGTIGSVTDNGNGTYTATLTSATAAGTATISGTLAGSAIAATATVTFTPGAASLTTSTITASPTTITADGTSTSIITVQLKDEHGNNLTTSGGTILLSSTHGSLGTVVDNGNGTYTATLTAATTAGTATITGTLNSSALSGSATVAMGPRTTLTLTKTAGSHTLPRGGTGTFVLTVLNSGSAATDGSTITVVDTVPVGLLPTSAAGSGWGPGSNACAIVDRTVTCTRSGALAAGASFEPITITVAVAADAPSPLVNTASVSGGGATDGTGSVTVDTAVAPDLTITLEPASAFVRGQAAAYTIRVTNSGGLATSAPVAVVHTLPAGLTVAALSGTGWSCDAAALTCTRADALTLGQSYPDISLTVVIASDAASTLTTTAVVSGGGETNTTNNTATHGAAAEHGGSPDLTLSKAAAGTFLRGEQGVYVLGVRNVGSAASAGVVTVTDTVPAGSTPASASGAGWACSIAGQTVSCTRSDALAPGASFPDITLAVGLDPFAPDSMTNTAMLSGGGDTSPGNNTVSAHATIGGAVPSPDLELTVREASGLVQGGTGEIVLDLRNRGSGGTNAPVSVTLDVPEPLETLSATGAGWACSISGRTVTCTRGDLLGAGHAFPSITIAVRVPLDAPLTVSTTGSASGGGADPRSALRTITIERAPHDLTIAKTHAGVFLRGQRDLPYTLTVSNRGTGPTWSRVTVVDTLPEGLVATAASGAGWSCAVTGGQVSCERDDELAPGAAYPAITLVVRVAENAPAEVTNVATVGGGGTDADLSNNTASDVTTIRSFDSTNVEIGVEKRADRSNLRHGEQVTFEITVDNLGGARLDGVVLRDVLPHGFQYIAGTAQIQRGAGANGDNGHAAASPAAASGSMGLASVASGAATGSPAWEAHDPQGAGSELTFGVGDLQTGRRVLVRYDAHVTPLAQPGANLTRVFASSAGPSGERVASVPVEVAVLVDAYAFATTRVLMGRVFEDTNGNGRFDAGERGVAGVRVLLATGQSVTTDSRGMYSFPVVSAGTTAVAVDPSTVPAGYALSKGGALHEGPSRLMRTPLGGFGMLRQNFPLTVAGAVGDFADAAAGADSPGSGAVTSGNGRSGAPGARGALQQNTATATPRAADSTDPARPGAAPAAGVPWSRAGATQAANVASFEIRPERTTLYADGRDRTEVRIRALDANGLPVVGGYVTLSATAGSLWVPRDRVAAPDAMTNGLEAPSWQATGRLGRTGPPSIEGRSERDVCSFVEPEPGAEASDLYRRTSIDLSQTDRVCLVADVHPGLAILRAHQGVAGDAAGEAVVELTVPARAPMVVAIGEVVIAQRAPEPTGDSASGRVQRMGSFFFQDSFGDNGRLTLAATSTPSINSATGAERMFHRDPLDRIYPVLGDGSTRLELAQSNSRMYARVDLGGSHVMFGDIRGDVSDGRSRLIDFQRSLTGVRAHLANGGDRWVSLVVSSPDTAFSRDVFPGSGGAYLRLNRGPVIPGSEIVTLEVRDRRSPERVLSRDLLVRSADYHLDPLTGVVYLLRPLPALTSALDLVQVVVTYESRSNGGPGSDVILARSNQRIDALGLDIRASALRQGAGIGGLTVGGVELTQRMPASGQLRVELPMSRSTADGISGRTGTGIAARIDLSQPLGTPGAFLRGRFTRTDREFDNPYGQQVVPGQTSGEASLEVAPFAGSQLRAILGHEANETSLVDNARTTAGAEWAQRLGDQIRLTSAFTARRLVDDLVDRRVSSQMASAGVEWRLGSRVEALARREQNLGSEADPTYPTQTVLGGKYQVTRLHSIFATQRLSSAPIVPTSDTSAAGIFTPLTTRELAVGLESRVAQHTSVLSRYRREGAGDTTDAFAVIGVLSRLPITRMLSVDGGVDHAHHLEGTGRSYSSASSGLTFMPHEEMRASWFYQLRMREERQHVLWTGVTGRMLPWLTGLGQYRWLRSEGRAPVEGDQLLGALAVRPVESDRVGLLLSYEHGDFENALVGGPRRRTGRLSTDGFYQPADRLELYTRLARIDTPAFATVAPERTYVWQGRAQVRILSRLDLAAETRHLSPLRGTGIWVAAGETGLWVSRDLRIGLGYSNRPMAEPGQAVTITSGRAGAYIVFSTRLSSLFDLGERFGAGR